MGISIMLFTNIWEADNPEEKSVSIFLHLIRQTELTMN